MNELRWILVGFGIVLLAGIYLWGRRAPADSHRRSRAEPDFERGEPPPRAQADPASFAEPLAEAETSFREPAITAIRPATLRPQESQLPDDHAPERIDPDPTFRRGRVEPTLTEHAVTVELPVDGSGEPGPGAPTLSLSDSPPPRRIERRKILALRLASGAAKFQGDRLMASLTSESLQHGKYGVFHRLHSADVPIFSVASMMEPGTFDLERMPESHYPGITMFAQLPGPVPGMHALNELVACARRLQQTLGGTLQDERGVPLTVHRIERLRQEVREFERPPTGGARSPSSSPSASP